MPIEIDEREHSLEMHLPFIKKVFHRSATLIPMLVGSLTPQAEAEYGKALSKYLDDDDSFIIVSSDFCHWGRDFDYTFLTEEGGKGFSEKIKELDMRGIK